MKKPKSAKNVPIYFFVGSTNPVKINAVKQAVVKRYPWAEVIGVAVASGVSVQPFSDAETKLGATNRARAALETGLAKLSVSSLSVIAVGIGLEGGVIDGFLPGEMWNTVWVVVVDQQDRTFAGSGARFQVPEVVAERIRQGEEMGVACAHLTGIDNVKEKSGLIGVITENFTDRLEAYVAIAKLSLGLWLGQSWQENLKSR